MRGHLTCPTRLGKPRPISEIPCLCVQHLRVPELASCPCPLKEPQSVHQSRWWPPVRLTWLDTCDWVQEHWQTTRANGTECKITKRPSPPSIAFVDETDAAFCSLVHLREYNILQNVGYLKIERASLRSSVTAILSYAFDRWRPSQATSNGPMCVGQPPSTRQPKPLATLRPH